MRSNVQLYIDGQWIGGGSGRTLPFWNPATREVIGEVAVAERSDLDRALDAAGRAFRTWRRLAAFERYKLLRRSADLLRERVDTIGPALTREEGKTLAEAKGEVLSAADLVDWFAEEGRRTYGRVIPSRTPGVHQFVVKEPVGVVAGFSPWNFPISQAVRKITAALAAGCPIIMKGPEETPASCAALVQALHDAGVPPGVVNLVFGVPSDISEYLIPHPTIRKISFTGSTVVGKRLASLAGQHMKRTTMELGGHSATIVFDDADLDRAASLLSAFKFRNAGQVCASPTRLLVHEAVYDAFVSKLAERASSLKVGDGFAPDTNMGPLANPRRVDAMQAYIADAVEHGAEVVTGGHRIGEQGNFFEPTLLAHVPREARIMNEEPFGPVALIQPFRELDEAMEEANRLAYGLAAYAYTRSADKAAAVADAFESGMVSINHHGLALPEVPFGGVKDSGYGSEGGTEALESYLVPKFVTHAA
jgi:succinate-semialdehyde dehydrogenase / glutarate-semialdehyde dehydrogenase